MPSRCLCVCGGENTTNGPSEDPAVVAIVITPAVDTIRDIGSTLQLVATAHASSGAVIPNKTFLWSSSNDAIASVSNAGLVTARAFGSVVIAASTDNVVGIADVLVEQVPPLVRFSDETAFLAASLAVLTVSYPNARRISSDPYTENGVTLEHAVGFNNDVSDHTPNLTGNEFGVSGAENVNITFAQPVRAFGVWMEDGAGMDSQFTFTFLNGATVVGMLTEDPPTGEAFFLGVILSEQVDRVEVREIGSAVDEFFPPFNEDDYFGRIYTRTN